MNVSTRHHTVPQMLLRRFADNNEKLYFFDERSQHGTVEHTNIVNTFVNNNFHTQYDIHGNKDVSTENKLASIEGEACRVFDKIEQAGVSCRNPNLCAEEKEILDKFVYFQWKRTPEFTRDAIPPDRLRPVILEEIEKLKNAGRTITPELADIALSDRNMNTIRAGYIGEDCEVSIARLSESGIRILINKCQVQKFIVGSNPILLLPVDKDLFTTILPLSPEIAIQYGFPKNCESLLLLESEKVNEINILIAAQSDAIASSSHELVKNLMCIQSGTK